MTLLNGSGGGNRPRSSERLDELLRLLAAPERRLILTVLHERDGGPVTLDSLARAVRDRLSDSDRDRSPTKHDLRVSFHHVHLPKLSAAGVVEYDDEAVRLLSDPLVDWASSAERGQELG